MQLKHGAGDEALLPGGGEKLISMRAFGNTGIYITLWGGFVVLSGNFSLLVVLLKSYESEAKKKGPVFGGPPFVTLIFILRCLAQTSVQ